MKKSRGSKKTHKKPWQAKKSKRSARPGPDAKPRRGATPMPREKDYPMRINRYLALKNHATRRGADDLIRQKKVLINGKIAVLGDKILETDVVTLRQKASQAPRYAYIAFNKPIGMMTSAQNRGENDIIRSLPKELQPLRLFPIGRLDKESHGLIILTNDGRITDKLLNPKYEHEKEYLVSTARPLRNNFKEKMEGGINIEGYVTKPARVEQLDENTFRVALKEGKTHQVRRMVSAVFNEVTDLERIRIMNIELGNLPPNSYKILEGKTLTEFLRSLGL